MYTKEKTLQKFYLFRRLDTKEYEEENIYPFLSFSLSLFLSLFIHVKHNIQFIVSSMVQLRRRTAQYEDTSLKTTQI